MFGIFILFCSERRFKMFHNWLNTMTKVMVIFKMIKYHKYVLQTKELVISKTVSESVNYKMCNNDSPS